MLPDLASNTPHVPSDPPTQIDDFFKKMEAQTKEWDAELSLWGAKARTASEKAKAEFHQWQRDFRDQRAAAVAKVETMRAAKHDAWGEVKVGAEAAWADLAKAFDSAKKKFTA